MGIAVDYDRMQAARDVCLAQVRDRRGRRLRPAVVSLYAASSVGWEFRGRVTGMFSDSYELVRITWPCGRHGTGSGTRRTSCSAWTRTASAGAD